MSKLSWRREKRESPEDLIDLSDPRVQRILKVSRIMSGIGTKLMFAPAYKNVRTPYGRRIIAKRRAANKIAKRSRQVNYRLAKRR